MRTSPLAIAILLCMAVGTPRALAAQQDVVGEWQGHWTRAGDTLAVTMNVRRDPETNLPRASFDADRLRVSGIPFTEFRVDGCCDVTMVMRGDRTTMVFSGRLRGNTLAGEFSDEDGAGSFAFVRSTAPPSVAEQEVTFRNGDVTLAGTLIVPRGPERHAGVVFAHGSGPEGRWASR